METVKNLLLGKTIEEVKFDSWKAPDDTLILRFSDKTSIKIMSDPNCCFDGLKFYIKKSKTVTYEQEFDEEIK
jgi:hypothetical protein